MNTLELLCENIQEKQRFLMDLKGEKPDKRNKAWELYDQDPELLITASYGQILSKIEIKSSLTDLVRGVGGSINRELKLRKDEVGEMHIGWFVITSYFDLGILDTKRERPKKKNGKLAKHSTFAVRVRDMEALNSIMEAVDKDVVELFPSSQRFTNWVDKKFHHPDTGHPLIKKNPHKDAVASFRTLGAPYLIDTLNKLGSTGWRINSFVFDTFKKCKYLPPEKTPFKFAKEVNKEKRASLEIEARAIERLAERHIDNAFYHLYNVDFRGRIYPNTAFLHEQSSDNAKGLLLLDSAVALGENGSYWLGVHTANMWGNDKVSLDDRAAWVEDNFDTLMSYVEDPMKNDDWMTADKPFCFLSACYEWSLIRDFEGEVEDFPSCLPIYIDGSNNGVQHLAAMSKDEVVAPLVNLVPQELPGDVYMFVAEKTIEKVTKDVANINEKSKEKFEELHSTFVELTLQKEKYSTNVRSELYNKADQRSREFGNNNRGTLKETAPLFWDAVKEKKTWRKTVKRPVMTLGYGGTQFGMVEMVQDDTRDLSEYLRDKHKEWSSYLGASIYQTCYKELKGPAAMLRLFEGLGVHENEKDRPISYKQCVTGFRFVHPYKQIETKEVELFYGDESFRLNLQIWKEDTLGKKKQKQSAAPNIVHSVDAAHLTMIVHDADYETTVVHDSFGCHAGNMEHMFMHVREKFVELYDLNPLEAILGQMDALHLIPEKGTLDVRSVIESDYAFA